MTPALQLTMTEVQWLEQFGLLNLVNAPEWSFEILHLPNTHATAKTSTQLEGLGNGKPDASPNGFLLRIGENCP